MELLEKYQTENKDIPDWIVNEAHFLNDVLEKNLTTKEKLQTEVQEDNEIVDLMREMIDITYFVEMPHEWIKPEERGQKMLELFKEKVRSENGKTGTLADRLAETRSSVSIAMSTLDDSTAEAIKFLNKKNIPVIAWTVLSDSDGYWTNALNVEKTEEKIKQIEKWKEKHNLQFDTYGFDLEKSFDVILPLLNREIGKFLKKWLEFNKEVKETFNQTKPQNRLNSLLSALKEKGQNTEFYIFPKKVKSFFNPGIFPPKNSREIEMVYTSDLPLGLGVSALLSKNTIPAIGILNDRENETPGRGKNLPTHQTPQQTERNIKDILQKRINLKNREFNFKEFYVFALNGRNVQLQILNALEKAFEELKKV